MSKIVKENKAATILVLLLLVITMGGIFLLNNSKRQPMATLENFSLPDYGEYDNKTAKYLIILPLKAIVDPNIENRSSEQTLGYGLLGASLLNTGDEYPMLGYRSFFLGGSDIVGLYGVSSKMEASFLNQGNIFLINTDLSIAPTNSIIRKREAVIYGVAFGLTDRYTYRNSTRELVSNSETYHITESDKQLKNLLIQGNQVFDEIKSKGYEDLTLKYALGILYASLKNDGVSVENINEYKFGTPQIYSDALTATLSKYPSEFDLEEKTFIELLTNELSNRDINMLDLAFFKKNSSRDTATLVDDTPALIKIIEEDLDKVSR